MSCADQPVRQERHRPDEPDDLDIITPAELAAAMRHVFVPRDADRYAAEVFQAKAEGGGPMMATGYTLAYVMMVSPELETRVRAHLGRRGTTAADIDALLERAKAFIASRNGERLTMDDPANGRTSLG